MRYNTKIMTAIIISLVLLILNIIPGQTTGKEITNFDNGGGQPSVEVELLGEPGFCSDATTYFSIPIHKGKIQEASLKVTTQADQYGNYLLDPALDVGVDGDIEWAFTGNGFGSFGYQNQFSTGMDRRLVSIGNRYKNSFEMYLPEGAFVTDASMNVVGGNLKYGEVYIALVNSNGNIYYIKSKNNGNFGTPQLIGSVGSNSYGIGMGDFDNDGDYDIIVNQGTWSMTTGNIYLFRKDGPGANFTQLSTPVGTTNSGRNTGFAVGDFDNDRNLDFIESEWGSNFYFFKGNGTNTFTRYQIYTSFSGSTPYEKDAADFNLDGNLDFVIGCSSPKSVYVAEGNGDGTFKAPFKVNSYYNQQTTWSWGSECAVAGDYDNDGNADILAKEVNWNNDWDFRLIKGNGDLTFQEKDNDLIVTNAKSSSWDPRADGFDFNFDGNQDLVTVDDNPSSGTIKCYWGDGNGNFKGSVKTLGTMGWGIQGIAAPPTVLLGGCDNMEVDIGADGGVPDFTFNGSIDSNELIAGANFKNKLNSILAAPPDTMKKITDDYGNSLIRIPIEFRADAMGNVLVQNLTIRYSYTADVDVNPHNSNLVNELNDLIPQSGKGDYRVYFNIKSKNPGRVKFSDLSVKFNEAPSTKTIPNFEIKEGSDNFKVVNLASYFNDDEQLPEELKYSVYSNTKNEYVKVNIFDNHYLHVDATKDPDWYGNLDIIVAAEDKGAGITRSNEFTVVVKPVNDLPRIGQKIENIDILINTVSDVIRLDSRGRNYFYDVDSDNLYFKVITFDVQNTGEYEDIFDLQLDYETNEFKVQTYSQPKSNIPIRIFCSDNEAIKDMGIAQLINYPIYQQIFLNITKFGKDQQDLQPPIWRDIKDIEIPEDENRLNWINLNNYTRDSDDPVETLTFTINSVSNSAFMNVYIISSKDGTRNMLNIEPEENYDGESEITIRVEDDDHNFAIETFKITIDPKPDVPTVKILAPNDNSFVTGTVIISGSAIDAEDKLARVEVKIGNSGWVVADGLEYWSYTWNSLAHTSTSDTVNVKVRAMDTEQAYSIYDSITLNVDNVQFDSDSDTVPDIYDACPQDPINWKDSDGDGFGDNSDRFVTDPTQWSDQDNDGYGDNPTGNSPDQFPFDPTQWFDRDGDGLGDNLYGNNPDEYPNDPKNRVDDEVEEQPTIFRAENWPWFTVVILIILDLLIFNYYVNRRRKIKQASDAEEEEEKVKEKAKVDKDRK